MKSRHGAQIWDLCINIILSLSDRQCEVLYDYLISHYTRRSKIKLYNADGEEDKDHGLIRLMPSQYQTLRTKYGDNYIKKSFKELTNYIKYLDEHQDFRPEYKGKFKKLSSGSHMMLLGHPNGWVFQKCKNYICVEPPKIPTNPYMIDDFNTAREYVKSIPREFREESMDVQGLFLKFPELASVDFEDNNGI